MLSSLSLNVSSSSSSSRKQVSKKTSPPTSPLKFSSDLDFVVPANFVSRDEFAATMLAEFLSDAVVFKVIDLKTRKTATISCCREGLIIMDKSTLRAFHHFRSIANFVAPPAGGDSESYSRDPAGYVVESNTGQLCTLLFRFEKPQERHLFLNVVSRASAELAAASRFQRPVYRDKTASPGLCDATSGVVSAIRNRRARERAESSASPCRKALRFDKEEQLIQSAIAMKQRTATM